MTMPTDPKKPWLRRTSNRGKINTGKAAGEASRAKILKFIEDSTAKNGYPPTVREIGKEIGYLSSSTTQHHLAILAKSGKLIRHPGVRSAYFPMKTEHESTELAKQSIKESIKRAWILTSQGHKFHILNPQLNEIDIIDIAHSQANQSRFTGHTCRRLSIAEHSLKVADIVHKILYYSRGNFISRNIWKTVLWGLLHDAAEAYLVDLAKPVKMLMPEYCKIEDNIMQKICEKYDLDLAMPTVVKLADKMALAIEAKYLMPKGMADCEYLTRYLEEMRDDEKWVMEMYESYTMCADLWVNDRTDYKRAFLNQFALIQEQITKTELKLKDPN